MATTEVIKYEGTPAVEKEKQMIKEKLLSYDMHVTQWLDQAKELGIQVECYTLTDKGALEDPWILSYLYTLYDYRRMGYGTSENSQPNVVVSSIIIIRRRYP